MSLDESVLVVPAARVPRFRGFRPADAATRSAILDPAAFQFRPRSEVETDPSFQQLIPYVVLLCGDAVFHYRRGSAGTETRLRARRSVGVGGHVSEADAAGSAGDSYGRGMRRELAEEVAIETAFAETLIGFIRDDRTPVGAVHLGVVHLFELAEPKVMPREDAIADAGFAPVAELIADRGQFETWSQFVFDVIGPR